MMYGRVGLERFKKAQSSEPFSVNSTKASTSKPQSSAPLSQPQHQHLVTQKSVGPEVAAAPGAPVPLVTQVGGGQSTWQPPDWATEPRPGFFFLEVLKDGEVIGRIDLNKRRHIFGRQLPTCDFVLDHQSVSRQHAAVVPHKNGSIYVIDLGSVHGTFVANERLTKDNPIELEVGQSLRFAASTRFYILRKNMEVLMPTRPTQTELNLPPPPDPSDEEAVVVYNTMLNQYGLNKPETFPSSSNDRARRSAKRVKKARVSFRDQVGGELSEVVGVSDGADVETEPGPVGVKEGSLVGQYESLVKITVIPRGKEHELFKERVERGGVTDKLKEILNKVRSAPRVNGIYDDLYGDSCPDKVGSSWAFPSAASGEAAAAANTGANNDDEDEDDLFGD